MSDLDSALVGLVSLVDADLAGPIAIELILPGCVIIGELISLVDYAHMYYDRAVTPGPPRKTDIDAVFQGIGDLNPQWREQYMAARADSSVPAPAPPAYLHVRSPGIRADSGVIPFALGPIRVRIADVSGWTVGV